MNACSFSGPLNRVDMKPCLSGRMPANLVSGQTYSSSEYKNNTHLAIIVLVVSGSRYDLVTISTPVNRESYHQAEAPSWRSCWGQSRIFFRKNCRTVSSLLFVQPMNNISRYCGKAWAEFISQESKSLSLSSILIHDFLFSQ